MKIEDLRKRAKELRERYDLLREIERLEDAILLRKQVDDAMEQARLAKIEVEEAKELLRRTRED